MNDSLDLDHHLIEDFVGLLGICIALQGDGFGGGVGLGGWAGGDDDRINAAHATTAQQGGAGF